MNFDLSEEQTLLKTSVERLLADRYNFERRRTIIASGMPYSSDMWRDFAEMGLLALPFGEADGGLGGGPVDIAIVMEALGGALSLEPYFPTVVLGGGFVRLGGNAAQRQELLGGVMWGETKLAFAQVERNSRYDLHHVETTARRDGSGWRLFGKKFAVLGAPTADRIFVTARTAGAERDPAGIGVFLVDRQAPGITIRPHVNQDSQQAAEIELEGVAVSDDRVFGHPEDGLPLIRRVVECATAALCAEAIGVMSAMEALTVDYLKIRKQFGVPIGSFQALQHMSVDMFIALEQARSIAMLAAMQTTVEDDGLRRRAIHAAKAQIGKAGRLVGHNAVQLHGGVGMTMEYAVGHYFRRMVMIGSTFGDTDHHIHAYSEESRNLPGFAA